MNSPYDVSEVAAFDCNAGEPLDATTCEEAANYYDSPFNRVDEWDNFPKGCFWNWNGQFYFNTHSTGAAKGGVRVVCSKTTTTTTTLSSGNFVLLVFFC